MIEQYEVYCLADRDFYDALAPGGKQADDFPLCARPVPTGWAHEPTDTWMHYAPQGGTLPPQGWKIHVSARMADVERVLETVWDYCVGRGIVLHSGREIPFRSHTT